MGKVFIFVAQHTNGAITRFTIHVFLSAMSNTIFLNNVERWVFLLFKSFNDFKQVEVRLCSFIDVLASDKIGTL